MSAKIHVYVTPKSTVLDPQGVAVRDALRQQGASEAVSVRVGRLIEIEWDGAPSADDAKLNALCRDFLSNPVIEDFRIVVVPAS